MSEMDYSGRFTPVPSVIEWFKDEKTGLLWTNTAQVSRGVVSSIDYDAAHAWCVGAGGRLPTCEELLTLVDRSLFRPASIAPGGHNGAFWSRTPVAHRPECNWVVDFVHGSTLVVYRAVAFCYVRAVDGEMK